MNQERLRQIEELHVAAPGDRAALDHADPELRREVRATHTALHGTAMRQHAASPAR